jgi:ParB/RepB/Spo0J family partition protein
MPRNKPGGSANTTVPAREIPLRPDAARAREVDISRVAPNPQNLRGGDLWESDEQREETVTSIKEMGLIQALVVSTAAAHLKCYEDDIAALSGFDFVVMAGHRRLEACRLAGLDKVRIDIQDHQVEKLDLLMLEENLKRKALSVFQEGEGYRRLYSKGASHAQIAKQVGKSKSHITKRIALLDLNGESRQAVLTGALGVDAAYNLLVALDGEADKVLEAAGIMKRQRISAPEAVNALMVMSTNAVLSPSPGLAVPVLPEPDALPMVPASREPEPDVAETPSSSADSAEPSSTEPVLPEPANDTKPPTEPEASDPPSAVQLSDEQAGRAQANAARDIYCRQLVTSYDKPATSPQSNRIAITAVLHASPAALNRAHSWLKEAGIPDAAAMAASSYRDSLLVRGAATLIARLAYAVALAEDELRASNRSRHWDYRDLAYLTHLIEAGYTPAEWERRQLG